jgi:hypothetical protein
MATNTTMLTRRSFSTWLAASGFVLTTSHRASAQDSIESEQFLPFAETRRPSDLVAVDSKTQERWTAAENESWLWYERESLVNGQWRLTGITTPVHRVTGECVEAVPGYLDESLVPIEYRRVDLGRHEGHPTVVGSEPPLGPESYGHVSLERRAQDGRPPSEWLRSMEVEELREWLSKIEVSEAGVHGMTFWTHLTRDHMFRPLLIKGLTEVEQAKLHAAAHFGY